VVITIVVIVIHIVVNAIVEMVVAKDAKIAFLVGIVHALIAAIVKIVVKIVAIVGIVLVKIAVIVDIVHVRIAVIAGGVRAEIADAVNAMIALVIGETAWDIVVKHVVGELLVIFFEIKRNLLIYSFCLLKYFWVLKAIENIYIIYLFMKIIFLF